MKCVAVFLLHFSFCYDIIEKMWFRGDSNNFERRTFYVFISTDFYGSSSFAAE